MSKLSFHKKAIFPGVLVLIVAAVLLAVDQIVKHFILLLLKPVGSVTLIPGWLEFSYVENTGAAFGLLKNQTWFLLLATAAVSIAIVVLLYRYRKHTFFSYSTSALLLAGGIGNLLDRLFYGYVVDYIHVMFFPYVFNFADCCVTVGAVLFVIHCLISAKNEEEEKQDPTSKAQEEDL